MPSKILIIIPAYNEEHIIEQVVNDLHSENSKWNLLVINDGSMDKTKEFAESTGLAKVINLPFQVGIGSCVQTGFIYAHNNNFDYAIQFDGDGQHKVCEIEKLLKPLKTGDADIVIGSRFYLKNKQQFKSSFLRYIGNKFFTLLNSILIKQKITDNTSGFRAYNRKSIKFLSENYPSDYPEPEAIILLGKNGFRMKEIQVSMNQRIGGKSTIYGLYSLYYMIKVFLSIMLTYIRPKTQYCTQTEEHK